MKFVQPIRDTDQVTLMMKYLRERSERDALMFAMGVYAGLRISDILALRVRDVQGKSDLVIRELKTRKSKLMPINPKLKRMIAHYIAEMEAHDYLFQSRQGTNRPITRVRAYQILREAADALHIDSIGTHSLRKTFGYHIYRESKDIGMLQDMFNHSTPYVTLRYIGINRDQQQKSVEMLGY